MRDWTPGRVAIHMAVAMPSYGRPRRAPGRFLARVWYAWLNLVVLALATAVVVGVTVSILRRGALL